ncbi:MAG: hypothetical protein HRU36_02095 [Rickettsiales bacterium]|nr:hypothetical protein [Rickettsiales bacterium]
MFKIICDVILATPDSLNMDLSNTPIAPAAKKYNVIIKYKNCIPCPVSYLPLTSTTKIPPAEYIFGITNAYSNQGILMPTNHNYYEAYEKILDKIHDDSFDFNNMKFIGIFASDSGLSNLGNISYLEVFQTIIDTTSSRDHRSVFTRQDSYETGYQQYFKKYVIMQVTNTTGDSFFTLPLLEDHGDNVYIITKSTVAYLLRNSGAMGCPELTYNPHNIKNFDEIANQYFKFIEQDIIESLQINLSSFRLCASDSTNIMLANADPSFTYQDQKTLCENLGGALNSMREMIRTACNTDPSLTLAQNEVLTITCENYKSNVYFNKEGEIVNTKFIEMKLSELTGQNIELNLHEEL